MREFSFTKRFNLIFIKLNSTFIIQYKRGIFLAAFLSYLSVLKLHWNVLFKWVINYIVEQTTIRHQALVVKVRHKFLLISVLTTNNMALVSFQFSLHKNIAHSLSGFIHSAGLEGVFAVLCLGWLGFTCMRYNIRSL